MAISVAQNDALITSRERPRLDRAQLHLGCVHGQDLLAGIGLASGHENAKQEQLSMAASAHISCACRNAALASFSKNSRYTFSSAIVSTRESWFRLFQMTR